MISAHGGLPAHRYTPKVTPRWPGGSEPASIERIGNNLILKCKTRKMGFLYAPKHKHMTLGLVHLRLLLLDPLTHGRMGVLWIGGM